MSGLSANTYSCGGDAGRFFCCAGARAALVGIGGLARKRNLDMPPLGGAVNGFSSSDGGTDERSDMSDTVMLER
jgi:hypothetical protein